MSSLFLSTILTNPSGHSWWYILRFFFFCYSGFSFDLHSDRVKNESGIFGFWFRNRSDLLPVDTRRPMCLKKGVNRVVENVEFGKPFFFFFKEILMVS